MTTSEQALILDARVQLRALLDEHPGAVDVLRERLVDGRIDGGTYWAKDCGCVLGTVAFAEGAENPLMEGFRLGRDPNPSDSPWDPPFWEMEKWAIRIRRGQVPDHTQPEDSGPFRAALLVSWIDEWKAERA
jgi:hypothetical protein